MVLPSECTSKPRQPAPASSLKAKTRPVQKGLVRRTKKAGNSPLRLFCAGSLPEDEGRKHAVIDKIDKRSKIGSKPFMIHVTGSARSILCHKHEAWTAPRSILFLLVLTSWSNQDNLMLGSGPGLGGHLDIQITSQSRPASRTIRLPICGFRRQLGA